MMVQPPSSVSSITSGSKSGTPFGSSDLSGCLCSFFTCDPPMRKYPLSQYRSRDGTAHCCYQLFGLHFASSRPQGAQSVTPPALRLPVIRAEPRGAPLQMTAIRFRQRGNQEPPTAFKKTFPVRKNDPLRENVGHKQRRLFDCFFLMACLKHEK